jgi:hypothetical protein
VEGERVRGRRGGRASEWKARKESEWVEGEEGERVSGRRREREGEWVGDRVVEVEVERENVWWQRERERGRKRVVEVKERVRKRERKRGWEREKERMRERERESEWVRERGRPLLGVVEVEVVEDLLVLLELHQRRVAELARVLRPQRHLAWAYADIRQVPAFFGENIPDFYPFFMEKNPIWNINIK